MRTHLLIPISWHCPAVLGGSNILLLILIIIIITTFVFILVSKTPQICHATRRHKCFTISNKPRPSRRWWRTCRSCRASVPPPFVGQSPPWCSRHRSSLRIGRVGKPRQMAIGELWWTMVNYGELWWTWYTPKMEILAIPGCWLDVPEENELNRAVWFVSYGLKFHWDSNGKIGIEKYWDYIHIYIYKILKSLGIESISQLKSQPAISQGSDGIPEEEWVAGADFLVRKHLGTFGGWIKIHKAPTVDVKLDAQYWKRRL